MACCRAAIEDTPAEGESEKRGGRNESKRGDEEDRVRGGGGVADSDEHSSAESGGSDQLSSVGAVMHDKSSVLLRRL